MSPTTPPRPRPVGLSPTLSLYIAGQYLLWLGGVLLAILGIIFLAEAVELLRRSADHPGLGLGWVLQAAALKTPYTAHEVLPFTVLASSMGTYWQLTRSNELVVARAAGVSVWQFLLPTLAVVFLLGVLRVVAFDPLIAAMMARFETIEARDLESNGSLATASGTGLWLRQLGRDGHAVIHAEHVQPAERTLQQVMVLIYDNEDGFVRRIDAGSARHEGRFWALADARIGRPDGPSSRQPVYRLPTTISFEQIANSFASARALSFWALPRYIRVLERTGLSAQPHRLQFQRLLALPLLLCSMVLLAAVFALRPQRKGGTALLIGAGTFSGFLLYFLSDIVFALGLSASIPLMLAAWTPAGVCTMLGIASLLHLEDG